MRAHTDNTDKSNLANFRSCKGWVNFPIEIAINGCVEKPSGANQLTAKSMSARNAVLPKILCKAVHRQTVTITPILHY